MSAPPSVGAGIVVGAAVLDALSVVDLRVRRPWAAAR